MFELFFMCWSLIHVYVFRMLHWTTHYSIKSLGLWKNCKFPQSFRWIFFYMLHYYLMASFFMQICRFSFPSNLYIDFFAMHLEFLRNISLQQLYCELCSCYSWHLFKYSCFSCVVFKCKWSSYQTNSFYAFEKYGHKHYGLYLVSDCMYSHLF